jgi:hypothetical protein
LKILKHKLDFTIPRLKVCQAIRSNPEKMSKLSIEEQKLFGNPEAVSKLLLNPMLDLVTSIADLDNEI